MSTLLLQTYLLFLGAFIVGAALACLFRRLVSRNAAGHLDAGRESALARPTPAAILADQPRPAADAASAARFERALTGERVVATPAAPATAKGPVVEVQPPAPSIPLAAPASPAPALVQTPAPQATAPAPIQQPITPPPARPIPPPEAPAPSATPASGSPGTTAAVAASAAAAAVSAAQRVTSPPPAAPAAPALTTPAAPSSAAPPVATSYDDLTRIRAIDLALQSRLNLLGVRRFQQIAAWKSSDVNLINQSLGFAGRIEQENWIEQAHILAGGGETNYSRQRKQAGSEGSSTPPAPSGPTPPLSGSTPPATAKPVAPATAPAGVSPGADRPFGVAQTAASVAAASVAAKAPETPAPAASAPAAPKPGAAPAGPTDRLHRILGINAAAESLLVSNGVTRFSQIAAWTPADVERFDGLLGRSGRIAKENWIEQAKVLAREGSGEAASPRPIRLDEAIRDQSARPAGGEARGPKGDTASLRSVRSEALRAPVPGSPLGRVVGSSDDLKRIRGVGVLIEKKLNSLGVTAYDQVANWTAADIDRISQILDFKGRIERENWIEQARILAAGGQTEFSRRVDRGEVETSRPIK